MTEKTMASNGWLKRYYYTRAGVAALWVAAVFTIGMENPLIAAVLLVGYPAWDALANLADAKNSGGLARNPVQLFNFFVSIATAIAVALALGRSMNAVFAVFGVWAGIAGILQLVIGLRRWKYFGAQWAMILSGAQSALAGGFFVQQAYGAAIPDIGGIAPYAAFGAFYFGVSAVLLTLSTRRNEPA
ncbi:DUF308 domain-containing protein [Methyloligella sp. 2.7D]|uniref:DUF308 domain-containing protein n=1 Tax=unclassified Methyloligella TaxID=2625955 RepID=UPI00157BFC4D|nr:DUF308 domain-containing protein [Methyloligella sp. GL2]QKP76239.1 DUF308 domain-containing protein [Methyloligella sp. GL2]